MDPNILTHPPPASLLQSVEAKIKYFNLHKRINILNYLKDMYVDNKFPTYDDVCTVFHKDHDNLEENNEFCQIMNIIGFEQRKTLSGIRIIIENPKLTFERYHYLKKVTELKSKNAPIYFIGERWVDQKLTFPKPWKEDDPNKPTCDGYTFFHAVSKDGFVDGYFCYPATEADFITWASHILLPLLKNSSIIVLDKSNLHTSNLNTITKYHSKKDMLQYLRKNNIPCDEKLFKAELYELIDKCTDKYVPCHLDQILKAHNHQVLHLPSTIPDLSLTEMMWKYVNETYRFDSTDLLNLKTTIIETLTRIPKRLWSMWDDDLRKLENQILQIDLDTEEVLEKNYSLCNHLPSPLHVS